MGTTTLVLGQNTGDTSGLEATYLSNGAPATNFNNGATLPIETFGALVQSNVILLRPNLSSIPAGAKILNVRIVFGPVSVVADAGFRARELKRAWVASQVTWNSYATASAWGTGGAQNATDRDVVLCEGTAEDSNFSRALQFHGGGLIGSVQAWLDGVRTNNGWLIQNEGPTSNLTMAGNTATDGIRPRVYIQYTTDASYWAIRLLNQIADTGARTTVTTYAVDTSAANSAFVLLASHGANPSSVTDSKGNVYTKVADDTGPVDTGIHSNKFSVWVAKPGDTGYVGGGTDHTFSANYASADFGVHHFFEITNVAATSAADVYNNVADSTTPRTVTTGTLAQANEAILAMVSQLDPNPHGCTSSNLSDVFSEQCNWGQYYPSSAGGKIVSATTSFTADFISDAADGTTENVTVISFKLRALNVVAQPAAGSIALAGQAPTRTIPQTLTFTDTQAAFGFFGFFDLTTTVGRRNWNSDFSSWTGYITGTDCTLRAGAGGSNPFWVSVDGGAETNPTLSGSTIPLFSGLADTAHLVQIRQDSGYAPTFGWTLTTGTFLSVTGGAPAIGLGTDLGTMWHLTDPSFPGQSGAGVQGLASSIVGSAFTPNIQVAMDGAITYAGGSAKFRATCSSIWAWCGDTEIWYAVDNGTWTKVTGIGLADGLFHWRKIASGLDGSAPHTYTVCPAWTGTARGLQGVMAGGSGASFSSMPAQQRIDQFGDSITSANVLAGVSNGAVGIYGASVADGFLGSAIGKSGQTETGMHSDMATLILPTRQNKSGAWALLAIGRNDGAAVGVDYTNLINDLLNAGYTKVICRGIEPLNSGADWPISATIAAAVAAFNDPRVTYIPVTTWTDVSAGDGTHPDAAGYVAEAAHLATVLSPYLNPVFSPAAGAVVLTGVAPTVQMFGGQFLSPDSDVSASGWQSSGSSLFSVIDEFPSDDTDYDYSQSINGQQVMEVGLQDATDPVSSINHVVRYRIAADSGDMTVALMQGATQIASWTHSPAPSTPQTFSQVLSGPQADAITDYTNLRLQFKASL